MSIHGIGCDLVAIERVAKTHARYGEKLMRRVLTTQERSQADSQLTPVPRLAKYLAAKEAAFKALGCGRDRGISWHDFEITYASGGQPKLAITGAAKEVLPEDATAHLSLSDTDAHALAYVIIESSP